MKEFNK